MSIINYMPSGQNNDNLDGLIKEYYVYAGENISAGSFVEFINGMAERKTLTCSPTNLQCNTSSGMSYEAVVLSENKVIMAYYDYYNTTTRYLRVRIVTINKNIVTPGTEYTLNSFGTYDILIEVLNPNKAIITYTSNEASNPDPGYAIAININGSGVITSGTQATYVDDHYSYGERNLCKLSDTSALISYETRDGEYLSLIVAMIGSDNSITFGTKSTPASYSNTHARCSLLEENSVAIIYSNPDSEDLLARKITINGTSISLGTTRTLFSSGDCSCNGIITIASDKILVKYVGDEYYFMICTISGTSFSKGTSITGVSHRSPENQLVKIDDNTVISLTDYDETYAFLGIDGTTLTIIGTYDLPTDVDGYSGTMIHKIADGRLFLVSDESSYFFGRVFVIEDNQLKTSFIDEVYETQVRNAITNPFDGVARTSGTGGTSTTHKDKISIYVPNI